MLFSFLILTKKPVKMARKRRRTKSAAKPKTVIRYRSKPVMKAKRRRTRRISDATKMQGMLTNVALVAAGGIAGAFLGKVKILKNKPQMDGILKMAIGGAGLYLATKQGMALAGAGLLGGITATNYNRVIPQLADSGLTLADYTQEYSLSDGDVFYDQNGNPMQAVGGTLYYQDGSRADAMYQVGRYQTA